MTGIEPGTSGTEQRTQNPNEAAPRGSGAGNQDLQRKEARDSEAESRRGGERMIDVEAERAGSGPHESGSAESDDSQAPCPLCDHPMGEHTIDRSHASAVLICPVPPKPEVLSYEPLNEVGMVKRKREDRPAPQK